MMATGRALAGVASLAALSQLHGGGVAGAAEAQRQPGSAKPPGQAPNPGQTLRVATCQFPVSGSPAENAK
jgi:hypothetical protein